MNRATLALAAPLCALLATTLPAHAANRSSAPTTTSTSTSPSADSYGTKASYAPQQSLRSYQQPPKGFVPVFTENVSRHGSRAATDSSDGDLILKLWDQAESEGQLTARGKEFGPKVRALLDAMAKVGYGDLSGRGKSEIAGAAVRMEKRLPGLFAGIARNGEKIDVVSSGQGRAVDSGQLFADTLAATDPALGPLIGTARTDKDLLYFHKAAGGAAYRDYIANDQRLATTLTSITDQPATHRAASDVLRKIFKRPFAQRIVDGEFSSVGSAVDAAEAVYNLYGIAPAMSDESPGGKGWHMNRYISQADAAWFGYLSDAEDFYEKGPGFAGGDITYKMANVLLDDFFKKAETAESSTSGTGTLGAELRFTHAEEIIPLAALMGLPGSTQGATATRPYTYGGNPWRGAAVAPMASNIQWDVFRKGDTTLVRMLYNEKETAFRAGCRPVSKGSKFYDLDELERCFGRTS
ncbi:histidine-type phosphatase [Streptomyces turgidiscabies]|uniref:Multiple inositol polyphosphate phosphatase 1 n=1 Tax=Streptomyces turgidiscabies (strain Car8) TaxID=698760 RepID=L7EU84_STRT8|nr:MULTISPECIES: histidine-type phosphatase [Streptomyces]ELP62271.1 histidine acid phosphatase [Streptomyces turgidiscabies Car8]MDX3498756.1 histidine-type phosphatase [Streptomyces turgidiscabies]GAQ74817.1 histidine phosphatase superfamily (branch 2 [Streptomyces turgidiscabies]